MIELPRDRIDLNLRSAFRAVKGSWRTAGELLLAALRKDVGPL